MAGPLIELKNVSKVYHRGRSSGMLTLKERLLRGGGKAPADPFFALRQVNAQVQPGEVLGIMGENGSGKSTLLKILAGITIPTSGQVEVHGRVAGLLEIGAGFHPEISGRENIFLLGTILGMSERQIRERYEEIVAFSEIGDFLEMPVKHYSSGMYQRLGFAVAIAGQPDVLLLDEVFAVGDLSFQHRCAGLFEQYKRQGRTIILVSHNWQLVQQFCTRGLLLYGGRVVLEGEPAFVAAEYMALSFDRSLQLHREGGYAFRNRNGSFLALVEEIACLDSTGQPARSITTGQDFKLRLSLRLAQRMRIPFVGISLLDQFDQVVTQSLSRFAEECGGIEQLPQMEGRVEVEADFPGFPLAPGLYKLALIMGEYRLEPGPQNVYDSWTAAGALIVMAAPNTTPQAGTFYPKTEWRFRMMNSS